MGHGVEGRVTPPATLDSASAARIAETLQALASPNRLMILTRLRQSPCSVGELSTAVGMEQPAVSHQLRLLRALDLVAGGRDGGEKCFRPLQQHSPPPLPQARFPPQAFALCAARTRPLPRRAG